MKSKWPEVKTLVELHLKEGHEDGIWVDAYLKANRTYWFKSNARLKTCQAFVQFQARKDTW